MRLLSESGLTASQIRLLETIARARRTTLLRWSFYLKIDQASSGHARFGHPDLYGHEIEVDPQDVFDLVDRGLLARFADGPRTFIEDYDITSLGLRVARVHGFREGARRNAWLWIPVLIVLVLALVMPR